MNTNQAFEILQKAGGIQAARIITKNKDKFSKLKVWWIAKQLLHGIPVAKIIHEKWFYGLPFYTNKYTLDPRPDTETLVESVIIDKTDNISSRILDLGTGTGCLIISIVKNIPNAFAIGIDKSYGAVKVAKRNVKDLELSDQVKIYRRSFDSNLNMGQFDIIVSNPPYIASNDDRVDMGAMHDPKMALIAKNNGLAAYETIAKNAVKWIKPNGKIYLEIGIDQGPAVQEIFVKNGWDFERSVNDLSGIERVLVFRK
ncbi:MAG: peptide chain release factor N(5)-glutamine methyltransferase [Rickettsiales bacterium]|jgi:release factor glutamine methyltransferase|nr:peptide chain release factor N(5)-glutamine methyltransferase [Rickettsiales bacterium]